MTLPLPVATVELESLTRVVDREGRAWLKEGQVDPIFEAIDAHKAARAALEQVLNRSSALDRNLPANKCQSHITAWQEVIVASDDPRWIECERAVVKRMEEEGEAAQMLITILPTTMGGAVALLQYALSADTDGERWPTSIETEEGEKRSWHHFLIGNLAEVLPALVKGVQS